MATRLSMKFIKSNGDTISMSYGNINPEVTDNNVNALMDGIISNGNIFEKVPATKKGADIITTTSRDVVLS